MHWRVLSKVIDKSHNDDMKNSKKVSKYGVSVSHDCKKRPIRNIAVNLFRNIISFIDRRKKAKIAHGSLNPVFIDEPFVIVFS